MKNEVLKTDTEQEYMPDSRQKQFLEGDYLQKKYLVPSEIGRKLVVVAEMLSKEYSSFWTLVVAGGVANGSLALRRMENPRAATDLDFYLVGSAATNKTLKAMGQKVRREIKEIDLVPDGLLNGEKSDYYLNLDKISFYIEKDEFELLSLPFQCAFGRSRDAIVKIIEVIMAHPRKKEIWTGIADAHAQSLSLHHGSWSDEFNTFVLKNYTPKKVEKFGLPETPEEYIVQLKQQS